MCPTGGGRNCDGRGRGGRTGWDFTGSCGGSWLRSGGTWHSTQHVRAHWGGRARADRRGHRRSASVRRSLDRRRRCLTGWAGGGGGLGQCGTPRAAALLLMLGWLVFGTARAGRGAVNALETANRPASRASASGGGRKALGGCFASPYWRKEWGAPLLQLRGTRGCCGVSLWQPRQSRN